MIKLLAFFFILTFHSSVVLAEENPVMDQLNDLVKQWISGDPQPKRHDELVRQLEYELSGESIEPNIGASMWATWILLNSELESDPRHKFRNIASRLLRKEAAKGNLWATKSLLNLVLSDGVVERNHRDEKKLVFNSTIELTKTVNRLWDDVVVRKRDFYISRKLMTPRDFQTLAWSRGVFISPYYNLSQSLDLYDYLISSDPQNIDLKLAKLSTLTQQEVVVDSPSLWPITNTLFEEISIHNIPPGDIGRFILYLRLFYGDDRRRASVEKYEELSTYMHSHQEKLKKEDWESYLKLLLEQIEASPEELRFAYKKSGSTADMASEILTRTSVFKVKWLDPSFRLVLARKILHQYLSSPGIHNDIEPGFYAAAVGMPLYLGFTAAVDEQDLDSMLYFMDAYDLFIEHPFVKNSSYRKDFDLLTHMMRAQFFAYNGDYEKAYMNGKKALDLLKNYEAGTGSNLENVPFIYGNLTGIGLMVGKENLFDELIDDYVFSATFNSDFYGSKNKANPNAWLYGIFGAALSGDEERFLKYKSLNEKAFHEAVGLDHITGSINAIGFYWHILNGKRWPAVWDKINQGMTHNDHKLEHLNLFVALKLIEQIDEYYPGKKNGFLLLIATSSNRYLAHLISKGRVPSKVYRRSLNKLISEMHSMGLYNSEEFQTLVSLSQTLIASRSVQFRHLDPEAKKNVLAHTSFKDGIGFLKSDINIQTQSTTFREVQEALKEDQAVIFSVMNDKSSLVFSITPSEVLYYDSPLGLREAVKLKSNILSSMDAGFDVDSSLRLYKELFSKAVSALPSATKELLFLPPEELSDLPLSLLATKFDSKKHDAYISDTDLASRGFVKKSIAGFSQQAKFLIEDYALSIIPSLKSVAGNENDSEGALTFLGVGAPMLAGDFNASNVIATRSGKVFSTQELHNNLIPLPDALEELKDTASYFPNAKLLIGQEATETNLKLALNASYNVISFATHALKYNELLETQEPSLVLSLEDGSDGLLSQSEILDYDLTGTDLVMLSACNTATAAAHLQSSSFTGLASSFLASGAKRVLVSHWPVISEAAKEIAIRTFKSPQKSYAKKLQNALIELIHSDNPLQRNPKYWGAFTLIQG